MRKKISIFVILFALISGAFAVPLSMNAHALSWTPPTGDFFDYDEVGGKMVNLTYWNVMDGAYVKWAYANNTTALMTDYYEWEVNMQQSLEDAWWMDTTWLAVAFAQIDPNQTGLNVVITANALKVNQGLELARLQTITGNVTDRNRTINLCVLSYARGMITLSQEMNKYPFTSPGNYTHITVTQRIAMYKDFFDSFRKLFVNLAAVYGGTFASWTPPDWWGFWHEVEPNWPWTKATGPNFGTVLENEINAIQQNEYDLYLTQNGRTFEFYYDSVDEVGIGLALVTDFLVYRTFFFHKTSWPGYALRGYEETTIVDKDGDPLPGVLVTYTNTAHDYKDSAVTDTNGMVSFSLPAGDYNVKMEKDDYETANTDVSLNWLQKDSNTYAMESEDPEDEYWGPYHILIFGGIAMLIVGIAMVTWRKRGWVRDKLSKGGKFGQ